MNQKPDYKKILGQMLMNEAKSIEMGTLLRSYATQEELLSIEQILENCKQRQKSAGKTTVINVLDQFLGLVKANTK